MEIANALVALGGDKRNSVPKYNLTAAEIAVLMSIHGDDSVYEIEPIGDVKRSNAEEIDRIRSGYRGRDEDGNFHVDLVYPGRAPVLHQRLSDLGLPDELFKATERMKPAAKKATRKAPPKDQAAEETEDTEEDVMS